LQYDDVAAAGNLLKKVFDEFVSPDYTDRGILYFYESISEKTIRERLSGESNIAVAKYGDRIAGYIEITDRNHIFLLFVDKEFHGKGVAQKLVEYSLNLLRKNLPEINWITVCSTSIAVPFYQKLGFVELAEMQLKNDIVSFPMKKIFR